MEKTPQTNPNEIIKGSRKIIKKGEYSTIYDPRIENYPGTHPLKHELSKFMADAGPKWIHIKTDQLEEVEAILDKYPEAMEPAEDSELE